MTKNRKVTLIISLFLACIIIFGSLPQQILGAADKKLNMTYIYTGNTSANIDMVDKTKNSLDVVCPSYFSITTGGSLYINDVFSTTFINEMHKRGIKVTPYLSNSWDRNLGRAALKNRDQLGNQIADAVRKYNLDGVNVDIENLNQDDRANYVDFVKKLRQKMGYGKIVSVAVSANPGGAETGWAGSYDYSGLAEFSDYLLVMTYDEHYQGGSPGPVAGAPFVENSIRYALGKVPKDKLLLGIPFYGRYWKTGAASGGYGLANSVIDTLIKKYNGKVEYDTAEQSAKALITIKPGNSTTVNGITLSSGTYTFWFDNEQSYKYKLKLVRKYDLKGEGSWALGQENQQIWNYLTLWLNGKFFSDIDGHWAQEAIFEVNSLGWMTGSTDTLFRPDNSLTRAEAATILVRALGLKTDDSPAAFPDTAKSWAKSEINAAYKAGLIKGNNGFFNPDQPITREEMAVILNRALKLKDAVYEYTLYPDVSKAGCSWSYQAICNTTFYGLFEGSEGVFKPENKLTRAEMATIMVRTARYMELQKPAPTPSPSQSPAVSPSPTPSPAASPTVSPSPAPSVSPMPSPSPQPTMTAQPSPTPTKTPKTAVPKTTPKPTQVPVKHSPTPKASAAAVSSAE